MILPLSEKEDDSGDISDPAWPLDLAIGRPRWIKFFLKETEVLHRLHEVTYSLLPRYVQILEHRGHFSIMFTDIEKIPMYQLIRVIKIRSTFSQREKH
jgi:hypothetical protein